MCLFACARSFEQELLLLLRDVKGGSAAISQSGSAVDMLCDSAEAGDDTALEVCNCRVTALPNQRQYAEFSVHFVPGMRVRVFDFAVGMALLCAATPAGTDLGTLAQFVSEGQGVGSPGLLPMYYGVSARRTAIAFLGGVRPPYAMSGTYIAYAA
eukprot:3697617-Rhodomonas_salina.2